MNNYIKKEFDIRPVDFDILFCVLELNAKSIYPHKEFVGEIVSGSDSYQAYKFKDLWSYRSFGPYISLRQSACRVALLIQHGLLTYIYDEVHDEMGLIITFLGQEYLLKNRQRFSSFKREKAKEIKRKYLELSSSKNKYHLSCLNTLKTLQEFYGPYRELDKKKKEKNN